MQQAQVINTNNFVMAADQNQQNQVGGALTEGSNDDGKTPKNVDGRKFVKGSVKFYNRTKSFGFIHGDDGQDYFVHESCIVTQFSSDVEKGLDDKQRVCFNPQIDTRSNKFRAVNVTILDDQAVQLEQQQQQNNAQQSAISTQQLVQQQFQQQFMQQQQQLLQMQAMQMSMHPAFQGYTPEQLQWTVVEQNATMFRQQANEMNPVLQQNNAQQQANAQLPFQTMTGLHQAAHVQQTHTGGLTPLTPQQQQPQSQQQLFMPFQMGQQGNRNSDNQQPQTQQQTQQPWSQTQADTTNHARNQQMQAAMMAQMFQTQQQQQQQHTWNGGNQ